MKGYPAWFKARLVHIIFAVAFLSGLALIPTTLFSRFDFDVSWKLGSLSRVWIAALHTFGGLLIVWLLGALWSIHMRYWWKKRRRRISGGVLLALFVLLILTSLGVLYAGDDSLARFTSAAHVIAGLAIFLPYLWHSIIKRRLDD